LLRLDWSSVLTDSALISITLVGLAVYGTGYVAPLAFFLPLRKSIAASYFDDWILAYAALTLASVFGVLTWGGARWWLLGTVIFATAGAISLLRIPAHLQLRRAPDRGLAMLGGGVGILSVACVFSDLPLLYVCVPQIGLLAAAYAQVAGTLWRGTVALQGAAGKALAVGFLLDGLWPSAVLLIEPARLMWLWGLVGGVVHVVVGVGLALLLVSRSATLLRESESGQTRQERFAADVVATISHELRTPLTVLKVSAWMLEDSLREDGTAERRGLAADMVTATDRLSHFMDRLLDLAQLEHGQVAYALEASSLDELAHEVAADMRPLFEQAGLSLELTAEAPAPCLLDPDRMRQVVTNLLGNALKFTPAGGHVAMEVATTATVARLTVRDSGPGLQPDELELVFQRFYRGRADRKLGLGLGLPLSRTIVEAGHQGRLWAESTPGEGATFHVEVPVLAAASQVR
jgi:signal transduction histidine kinase